MRVVQIADATNALAATVIHRPVIFDVLSTATRSRRLPPLSNRGLQVAILVPEPQFFSKPIIAVDCD
jgi:hypothetical protein